MICRSLASGASAGTKMCDLIPARAAYADTDAPAFPDESSTNYETPYSRATESIVAVPRSLNDPVGFKNSSLAYSFRSGNLPPMVASSVSGVLPSPRVNRDLKSCRGVGISESFLTFDEYLTSRGDPQPVQASGDMSAGRSIPHFGHVNRK